MDAEELRLMELDGPLLALPIEREAMALSELDGFVAALHCCPELIPPSEWLPRVWGEDDDDAAPFEDREQLERTVAQVLAHYNAVGAALGRRRYEPLFDIDKRNDDVLWELWIVGFAAALDLRPAAWIPLYRSEDEDAAQAIAGMTMLAAVDTGEIKLHRDELDDVIQGAPNAIEASVQLLYDYRLRRERPAPSRLGAKVGRNDPCPCGSGRKYKKCCGAH